MCKNNGLSSLEFGKRFMGRRLGLMKKIRYRLGLKLVILDSCEEQYRLGTRLHYHYKRLAHEGFMPGKRLCIANKSLYQGFMLWNRACVTKNALSKLYVCEKLEYSFSQV